MAIAEISSALTAANHVIKLVTGVAKTVRDADMKEAVAGIQDHVIDLQSKIFAVQAKYEELADVKRETEQKLIAYEQWDAQAARYRLQELAVGIFVYVLQPEHQNGEPTHWLCPHCFQQRKRSILGREDINDLDYKCHGCRFEIILTRPPRQIQRGGGY